MNTSMKFLALSAAMTLFLLTGCAGTQHTHAHGQKGNFTQHYSDTLFKVTEKEFYSVELLMDQGSLVKGENSFQVVIHNTQDQDVPGADLEATAFKPGSREATERSVTGVDRGGGLYTFSGLDVNEPGPWHLTISVDRPGKKDSATFVFDQLAMPGEGKKGAGAPAMQGHDHGEGQMHHHAATRERPDQLDMSSTVMSEKGQFKVSYEPMTEDIPIGRIHSWKISVTDAQGNPMDAKILVTGEMPEHGHGLPTEPEITQRLSQGVYRLDGLKFSMPGWWVMHVQVFTSDQRDKAEFNLVLQ